MGCLQDFIWMLAYKENHVDTTSKDVVDNMEKGFSRFFLNTSRRGCVIGQQEVRKLKIADSQDLKVK